MLGTLTRRPPSATPSINNPTVGAYGSYHIWCMYLIVDSLPFVANKRCTGGVWVPQCDPSRIGRNLRIFYDHGRSFGKLLVGVVFDYQPLLFEPYTIWILHIGDVLGEQSGFNHSISPLGNTSTSSGSSALPKSVSLSLSQWLILISTERPRPRRIQMNMTASLRSELPDEPIFRQIIEKSQTNQDVIFHDATCGAYATYPQLLHDIVALRRRLYEWLPKSAFDERGLLKEEESPYFLILAPGNYDFVVSTFAVLAVGGAIVPVGE